MREMYNASLGMGFVISGRATRADFANVLAVWSDELTLDDANLNAAYRIAEVVALEAGEQTAGAALESAIDKTMKHLNAKGVAGQPAPIQAPPSTRAPAPAVSGALAQRSGAKAGGKLGTKVAAKSGAKIAGKYAAKGATMKIPIVSAAVCAALNNEIMDSLLVSAEQYFRKVSEFRAKRYK